MKRKRCLYRKKIDGRKEVVGGVQQNGMLGASHGAKHSLQHEDETVGGFGLMTLRRSLERSPGIVGSVSVMQCRKV